MNNERLTKLLAELIEMQDEITGWQYGGPEYESLAQEAIRDRDNILGVIAQQLAAAERQRGLADWS